MPVSGSNIPPCAAQAASISRGSGLGGSGGIKSSSERHLPVLGSNTPPLISHSISGGSGLGGLGGSGSGGWIALQNSSGGTPGGIGSPALNDPAGQICDGIGGRHPKVFGSNTPPILAHAISGGSLGAIQNSSGGTPGGIDSPALNDPGGQI